MSLPQNMYTQWSSWSRFNYQSECHCSKTHGAPRAYHPNPKSPTGLSNDEIYELTQKQRYLEREIRADKRELRGMQQLCKANPTTENLAALEKAKRQLSQRQANIRELIKDANTKCKPGTHALTRNSRREWAGDMPKDPRLVRPAASKSAYPQAGLSKQEAIALAKTAERPVFCCKGDYLIQDAKNIRLDDSSYHMTMHGDPDACYVYQHKLTAPEFADILKNRNDYKGENLSLIACSLGDDRSGASFAQSLANELGVKVTAATRKLWPDGTEGYIIADKYFGAKNKGTFKAFYPQHG